MSSCSFACGLVCAGAVASGCTVACALTATLGLAIGAAAAFSGTPVANKAVSVSSKKLAVAS